MLALSSSIARRTRRRLQVSVGLGSWADSEYTGLLYPKGLPAGERLKTYATWFGHAEVNSTYYRTPSRQLVSSWVSQTPPGFRFDVKLHQAFSRAPERSATDTDFVARWIEATKPLVNANKLGAFLLVVPPSFSPGRHELEALDGLAEKFGPNLLAVELRDSRWVADDHAGSTLEYFRTRKLVWVAVDMPRIKGSTIMPAVDEVTNPRLAYLRLHGRNKKWLAAKSAAERHTYEYTGKELKEIAARVRALGEKAETVHVVANNHASDFAPKTALALQRVLGLRPDGGAGVRRQRAPASPAVP